TPWVMKSSWMIERQLGGARTKCEKENTKGEASGQTHANLTADKLKAKLEKLEKKGKLKPGCAAAYGDLIDSFKTADMPNATTTSTTTTIGGTTTTQVTGPVVISTGFSSFPAGTHIC